MGGQHDVGVDEAQGGRVETPYSTTNMKIEMSPRVTVIIPTRNSGHTIDRCLRSVRNQTYPNIEIIVIDARSSDETMVIVPEYAGIWVAYECERSAARNLGARLASGGYLLFVDSDMYLSSNVVKECVSAVGRVGDNAAVIPEVAVGEGFWTRCRAFEKESYRGDDSIEAARFFPRELFFALAGFDASLGPAGEDWDLTIRARQRGCKILRVNAHILHDEGRLTLNGTMKKKYYYGQHIRRFSSRYGKDSLKQLSPLRRAYLRDIRKLVRNPGLALGLAALKTSEYFAAAMGLMKGLVDGKQ